jgi:hypothetical protein
MASDAVLNPVTDVVESESWLPMIAIALGQALMSFNVAFLPVAIGGMVHSFNVPPMTVATWRHEKLGPQCRLRINGKMIGVTLPFRSRILSKVLR